jgi:hypothetical protein
MTLTFECFSKEEGTSERRGYFCRVHLRPMPESGLVSYATIRLEITEPKIADEFKIGKVYAFSVSPQT